ncbi:uncharacterized protein METZ01_LOCUS446166, partial [marine metagenome]
PTTWGACSCNRDSWSKHGRPTWQPSPPTLPSLAPTTPWPSYTKPRARSPEHARTTRLSSNSGRAIRDSCARRAQGLPNSR